MANKHFQLTLNYTGNANVRTVAQFLVPAQARVLWHGITLQPRGATSGSASVKWVVRKQTDAGGASTNSSAALRKRPPGYLGAIQTTVLTAFTAAEPTTDTTYADFPIAMHQQGRLEWSPRSGPIIMESSERWALIIEDAALNATFAVDYVFDLEE